MAAFWEIAAHSAYDMFCKTYKYIIVNLVFPRLGFWSGNFFLIAPFPDHCPPVPYNRIVDTKPSIIQQSQIYKTSVRKKKSKAYSKYPKDQTENIICTMYDVRGDFLWSPHGTTPAAV